MSIIRQKRSTKSTSPEALRNDLRKRVGRYRAPGEYPVNTNDQGPIFYRVDR